MSASSTPANPRTVVALGEILWDLFPDGPRLGGAPFNFANRIRSLGDNGIIVSRLGADTLGRQAEAEAIRLGMDLRYMQWDQKFPTGTVEITLQEDRSPNFHIVPGVAYDHLEMVGELAALAREADCVCFGTLIQRTGSARQTVARFLEQAPDAVRVFDINLRKDCHTPGTIIGSLEHATIAKINDGEARYVSGLLQLGTEDLGEIGRALLGKYSLSFCLITLADRGALGVTAAETVYVPGYRVAVVDTCGAGDAFTAGFVHAHLHGRPMREALELGCALGAMVASQAGATGLIPPAELEAFMRAGGERVVDPRWR